MRRSLLVLLCLLTLAGAFTGCNLFTKDVMSAIVYVQHYYTGRRAPDWDVITVPSIWLSGQVSGSKMPAFDYLQVNDKQISGRDIYFFEQGYVRFDSYHRVWQDSIAAPGFYPMTVTLATDIGELVGRHRSARNTGHGLLDGRQCRLLLCLVLPFMGRSGMVLAGLFARYGGGREQRDL